MADADCDELTQDRVIGESGCMDCATLTASQLMQQLNS